MDYVFLGPPGCGKGTQAQLLAMSLKIHHLCAGDLLRLEITKKTNLGEEIAQVINQGGMVPDHVISHLMAPHILEPRGRGFIYDGYPRSIRQAEDLDLILRVVNRSLTAAFWFDIPDDVLITRVSGRLTCQDCQHVYHSQFNPPRENGVCDQCGGKNLLKRPDDDANILKKRLTVFYERTKPIMHYYQSQNKLIVLRADRNVEEINQDLTNQVNKNF